MASRCVLVMRGTSIPFVVLVISSREDALGVVVPMPALPVAGKVLVCAVALPEHIMMIAAMSLIFFFILFSV